MKRSRSWAFVIYPESMPDNYLQLLNGWHIPTLISPVHDSDLNADDTEKKEHYHILFSFDGMKSYDQIKPYTEQLNGTIPIAVENTNGMIRYFIHYDNPEKHQYYQKDLIALNGFDYSNAFDSAASELKMCNAIESFIDDNNIVNFYVLIKSLKSLGQYDLINFIRLKKTYYFINYLKFRKEVITKGVINTDN